jgi:Ca-activated chloride channel family protein
VAQPSARARELRSSRGRRWAPVPSSIPTWPSRWNGVNRFLLEGIARAGGGEVDYVLLSEPGEEVARRFWARIAAPVLTDVRLEFRGLDVEDVYPAAPADVWAERPLIVHARYRRPGRGTMVLHGFRAGRPYREAVDVTLPEAEPGHAAIASMWARARVEELTWRDLSGASVREQIVEVALAHRLVTQFTSFVAVEERVVNEGGRQVRVTVPVDMPEGVSHEGVFGEPSAREARAAMAPALRGGAPTASLLAREDVASPRAKREIQVRARQRLAPELLALLDGSGDAAVPVTDGRVTVKVVLRDTEAATIRRLERAGLHVRQSGSGWVVGAVAVESLAALAEELGVLRVELP